MRKLDINLFEIKDELLILSACVKQSYIDILKVINDNDHNLALEIIQNDTIINEMEDAINQKVIQIIALQAPVATDLRVLISTLKISNQLERIADYVVNIADYFIVFADDSDPRFQTILLEMINAILMMLDETIKVLENPEINKVKEIAKMDKKIDDLYDQMNDMLIESDNEENLTKYYLRTILIAKYLERSGDHITNVLESIAYYLDGEVHNFNSGNVKRHYLKKG